MWKKCRYSWFCEKTGKSSSFALPCEGCEKGCPHLIKVPVGREISRDLRDKIFNRDKKCLKCGTTNKLTIDHIVPVSRGGSNDEENLQILCEDCNSRKGDHILDYR
jgi:5-methylcytosine-specific restriction endonuclease McrA